MVRKLDPLPSPSRSLDSAELPIIPLAGPFIRIHRSSEDPAFWGRVGNNRFDSPTGEYGILYASTAFHGAFIEVFGDLTPKTVSKRTLAERGVARLELRRALRLVDLGEAGLSRLGLDARICTGDHAPAQEWSHALWAHPAEADGLWYAARHDAGQRSVALFNRAAPLVTVVRSGGLMEPLSRGSTAGAIVKYGFILLP